MVPLLHASNLGQNRWKICTSPSPAPPQIKDGKWPVLAFGFILDLGGGGGGGREDRGLLFYFILSKIVV